MDPPQDSQAPVDLPSPETQNKLCLATSDMVEFGISLEDAASHHGVDPETLHRYYRTYTKVVGKDKVAHPSLLPDGERGFDRESRRQFDRNWAEVVYITDRDRPQPSAIRKWLMTFPLTRWMFNGDVVDKTAVTGAVCVLVFGLLAVKLTLDQHGEAGTNPTLDEGSQNPATLTEQEKRLELAEQISKALEHFVGLETWQERLPHVRDRERVAPLMEDYYKSHPDGPLNALVLRSELNFMQRDDGFFALANGFMRRPDGPPDQKIFLFEISGGDESKILVDWEVLVNYEPKPWEEFKAERSTEPFPFRVRILPGDYYNQPFMDEEKYAGYRLQLLHRDEEKVHGFAERDSEIVAAIESALLTQLSGRRSMILNLRYPEDGKFDDILEIESIVAEKW